MNSTTAPNPVTRTTGLCAVPGWIAREYADGTFDATNTRGAGMTWGCSTFREAVAAAKFIANGEVGDIAAVPGFLR